MPSLTAKVNPKINETFDALLDDGDGDVVGADAQPPIIKDHRAHPRRAQLAECIVLANKLGRCLMAFDDDVEADALQNALAALAEWLVSVDRDTR